MSGVGGTRRLRQRLIVAALCGLTSMAGRAQQDRSPGATRIPTVPLTYGAFTARFGADGIFSLEGQGWPPLKGTWKANGAEIEIATTGLRGAGCDAAGRYRYRLEGTRISFALISDDCPTRRMLIDRSAWRPADEPAPVPVRRITHSGPARKPKLPKRASAAGSWPSFRGPAASGVADGQHLPDSWDGAAGTNIRWKVPIPGLAHSSPIIWGNRIFVTTAISSRAGASFKPGLYGDGDASDDRSRHKWVVYAIDKRSGSVLWERVAFDGEPIDKRHIKSTYASATPATDGRLVVAWFGSQGVYAYDVDGQPLWKVDLGRMDLGAYDVPAFEWGPASSPIIWDGLVILQVDTQADSFILALDAATGKAVWRTDRDELPSWGTPTVAATETGPELVTNASNFIRGYDPHTGEERWRLGRSSKITAPTPIFADGLFVVASGRGPERPIFVIRPGIRGDVTLPAGAASSEAIAWSRTGRGSYMPTPLAYRGILYVLANNGILDAYDLQTGKELYRQRLPEVGSGFSASPVAADGRIYLSSEDGDIIVVEAGPAFKLVRTNPMGELLMATPALSDGVMYVRSPASLFAIGSATWPDQGTSRTTGNAGPVR
ncbi:MAG: PQQ-binding-like beta-propeller repeat protein [Acidobacteriota bacterium]